MKTRYQWGHNPVDNEFFVLKDDSFDCTLIAHLRIFLLFYRLLYCLILPENRLFFGIWKVVEIEFE